MIEDPQLRDIGGKKTKVAVRGGLTIENQKRNVRHLAVKKKGKVRRVGKSKRRTAEVQKAPPTFFKTRARRGMKKTSGNVGQMATP